jgi:hypothetical protein
MRTEPVKPANLQCLADARERDSLLNIEAYCREPGCPAREVHVHLKDYDETLLVLVRQRGGLHCPVCASVLVVHWAHTRDEHHHAEEQAARRSVNAQMYARDHFGENDLVFYPMSALCDDRLPPAPADWWAPRRTRDCSTWGRDDTTTDFSAKWQEKRPPGE